MNSGEFSKQNEGAVTSIHLDPTALHFLVFPLLEESDYY